MPVPMSRFEAREAARACRALAYQQRLQAEAAGSGSSEALLLNGAEKLERLAERFEAHARADKRGV